MLSKQTKNAHSLVLTRTNYGEADRIATLLTDIDGKVKVMVKGARKSRSKLAAGVELFSISEISYIPGRGELATLTSARLVRHFTNIVRSLDRVEFAYACLKQINTRTEQSIESSYFTLVEQLLTALDDLHIAIEHIYAWWYLQYLQLSGHGINLDTTTSGETFDDTAEYVFDADRGGFQIAEIGGMSAEHIKYARLCTHCTPLALQRVSNGQSLATRLLPALQSFVRSVH